ncbi:Anaphase-promoting complex subunit 5 [Halotydeus destructor]|nr:Anaphase-promoting complex subunit 5 [Halotydeus destructor]
MTQSNEGDGFVVSSYKIYLTIMIQAFMEEKAKSLSQRQVGCFSKLIMRLIQSLDCDYMSARSALKTSNIGTLLANCDEKVDEIKKEGLASLIEMINSVKSLCPMHRVSFVGLFNRKIVLYTDKLSFTCLSKLYEDFIEYTTPVNNKLSNQFVAGDDREAAKNNQQLWQSSSKQVHFFLSKQISLINIDEKKALNPNDLFTVISTASNDGQQSAISNLNELNFLRYVNSLRINEYAGARDALIAYFDCSTDFSSKCWAAFNLASMHFKFGHDRLALDAIKECISTAQEANDDKCLEFSLMLLAELILKKKHNSDDDDDLVALLQHIQQKATKLDLHFLAASAGLHYEQLIGSTLKRSNSSSNSSDVLAVKFSLNDLLLSSYANRSALFSSIGASDLSALTSQLLLHMYTVDPIGNELFHRVNENTAIGLRNIALYIWKNLGEFDAACDILVSLAAEIFSPYREINSIWKKSLAEIQFDYSLYSGNWKEALIAIDMLRVFDQNEAKIKLAELKLRQGNKHAACGIITKLLSDATINEHLKVRALILKSKILKNFSILLKVLNTARANNFFGLEANCIIELCYQLYHQGLSSQAIYVLRKHMMTILSNCTCSEAGLACYIYSICLQTMAQEKCDSRGNRLRDSIKYSEKSLDFYRMVNDVEYVGKNFELLAHLNNEVGDFDQRNYYARQTRILCMQ